MNIKLVILVLVSVLGLGCCLQFVNIGYHNERQHGNSLKAFVETFRPNGLAAFRDLPLGETSFVQSVVEDTLKYDDYVYREYRFESGLEIGLYIAYWGAGKQRFRELSRHTPDVCWVNSGWERMREDFAFSSGKMPPAQYRKYRVRGDTCVDVLFWQLAGGVSVAYPTVTPLTLPLRLQLRDFKLKGLKQQDEQYFVRISINDDACGNRAVDVLPEFYSLLSTLLNDPNGS